MNITVKQLSDLVNTWFPNARRVNPRKDRTISNLHRIWRMSIDRYERDYSIFNNYVHQLIGELTPESDGCYRVYYYKYLNGNKELNSYKIFPNTLLPSGFGYDEERIDKNSRLGKISYFIAEDTIEKGEKFKYLESRIKSKLHDAIFSLLWKQLKPVVAKKVIDIKLEHGIFTINIDGYSYFAERVGSRVNWLGDNKHINFNIE